MRSADTEKWRWKSSLVGRLSELASFSSISDQVRQWGDDETLLPADHDLPESPDEQLDEEDEDETLLPGSGYEEAVEESGDESAEPDEEDSKSYDNFVDIFDDSENKS